MRGFTVRGFVFVTGAERIPFSWREGSPSDVHHVLEKGSSSSRA